MGYSLARWFGFSMEKKQKQKAAEYFLNLGLM